MMLFIIILLAVFFMFAYIGIKATNEIIEFYSHDQFINERKEKHGK